MIDALQDIAVTAFAGQSVGLIDMAGAVAVASVVVDRRDVLRLILQLLELSVLLRSFFRLQTNLLFFVRFLLTRSQVLTSATQHVRVTRSVKRL